MAGGGHQSVLSSRVKLLRCEYGLRRVRGLVEKVLRKKRDSQQAFQYTNPPSALFIKKNKIKNKSNDRVFLSVIIIIIIHFHALAELTNSTCSCCRQERSRFSDPQTLLLLIFVHMEWKGRQGKWEKYDLLFDLADLIIITITHILISFLNSYFLIII